MLTSLIMSVWKGGRGVKAPYESTHVRVPEPIKEKEVKKHHSCGDYELEQIPDWAKIIKNKIAGYE